MTMLPGRASLAPHYESEISFAPGAGGRIEVTKRYIREHECISWLNLELAAHYDPAAGLPVAQHEFAAYEVLAPLGCVPSPVELRPDSIVVEYGGESLRADSPISESEYERQCTSILRGFESIGFRHNDLLAENVLIDAHARVRIIDFTLAEFGSIELMPSLPNRDWARPDEDAKLLDLLRDARREAADSKNVSRAAGRIRRVLERISR
jgi:hypothetical protein